MILNCTVSGFNHESAKIVRWCLEYALRVLEDGGPTEVTELVRESLTKLEACRFNK